MTNGDDQKNYDLDLESEHLKAPKNSMPNNGN